MYKRQDIVRVTVVNNSAEPNEKEGNKYKDISGTEYTLSLIHISIQLIKKEIQLVQEQEDKFHLLLKKELLKKI